ncbi:hypothetical protein DFJ74DRAFT_766589 [Hyaloraphidium curvatum]|nr:hypothetical protein DFJ74DRAFT_766589 [Hyaloraphidium curvatum]
MPASFDAPCRFHALGACRNGAACPFSHGAPAPPAGRPTTSPMRCRFFDAGGCARGADCRFAHVPRVHQAPLAGWMPAMPPRAPAQAPLPAQPGPRRRKKFVQRLSGRGPPVVCYFFVTKGSCKKGERCPWLHPKGLFFAAAPPAARSPAASAPAARLRAPAKPPKTFADLAVHLRLRIAGFLATADAIRLASACRELRRQLRCALDARFRSDVTGSGVQWMEMHVALVMNRIGGPKAPASPVTLGEDAGVRTAVFYPDVGDDGSDDSSDEAPLPNRIVFLADADASGPASARDLPTAHIRASDLLASPSSARLGVWIFLSHLGWLRRYDEAEPWARDRGWLPPDGALEVRMRRPRAGKEGELVGREMEVELAHVGGMRGSPKATLRIVEAEDDFPAGEGWVGISVVRLDLPAEIVKAVWRRACVQQSRKEAVLERALDTMDDDEDGDAWVECGRCGVTGHAERGCPWHRV